MKTEILHLKDFNAEDIHSSTDEKNIPITVIIDDNDF